MKKILITTMLILLSVASFGQTKKSSTVAKQDYEVRVDSLLSRIDTLVQINNKLLSNLDERLKESAISEKVIAESCINKASERFKLYPTENIYTHLLLNTETGQIIQVQWSLKSKEEGSVIVNSRDLSYGSGSLGTFELYPTKNMYQFILLNKEKGTTWHVQWGMKSSERWIREIY